MKSMHKPIAVKVGNVTVKIYRVKNRGYDSFQVADYSTGKRKLESFASEREARDVANTIAVKVAKLDGAVLTDIGQFRAGGAASSFSRRKRSSSART